MKTNIVISPSQQAWNKCAMGDSEKDHAHLIGQKVAELLKKYDCNVCLVPKITGTENETLAKVVSISNAFVRANPADMSYHLDIHSDGGYNGSGASAFFISEGGKAFVQKIWKEVANVTPWGDGGVSQRSLYVLRETDAIAGLIEVSFHDKLEQAKWIHMSIDALANAIVKGIVSATGIEAKPVTNVEDAKHMEQVTDVNKAIEVLVSKGIVNSPDYWIKAVSVTKNLDALIINMVKYINSNI